MSIYKSTRKILALGTASLLMLSACSRHSEWTVEGTVTGADGETMVLEASDNGRWYPLDSVTLDSSGKFSMSQAPIGYPDIYRLRLGDKTLYFPIDSIETVTVISKAAAFDAEYSLAGTPTAEKMLDVDRRLRTAINKYGIKSLPTDSVLKRELGGIVLGDNGGILSYYIINKRLGGVPLYDPTNKSDLRIIGAVANAYDSRHPNDPRTAYLKKLYLSNKPVSTKAVSDTIKAQELGFIDINLYDETGKKRSIKQLTDNGRTVLLNFTVYEAEGAPAFNMKLQSLYQKYKDKGFEIYQVSVDKDEFTWRQSARNLPWVTVYNPPASGARIMLSYNVDDIPVSFLIANGEIVERIEDASEIESAVAKHF